MTLTAARAGRDDLVTIGIAAAQFTSAALLVRAARHRSGAAARPWWFVAASAFASSLIFVTTAVYEARGDAMPFPSAADVSFLVAVCLMVPAMLAFPRRQLSRSDRWRFVLDGVIVAVSLMLIAWHLVIARAIQDTASGALEAPILALYPAIDVIALTAGVLIATRIQPGLRAQMLLVTLGLFALTVGDVAFGYANLTGSLLAGHTATVTWLLGYPIMVLAAYRRQDAAPLGPGFAVARETRWSVAGLMAPVVAALVVAAAATYSHAGVIALVLLVLLVLARQTLSLLGELRLRAYLEGEVQERTDALRVQAFRDVVTGLPNRVHLHNHAGTLGRGLDDSALLLLDLDGFKQINDSLGHAAGDELLVQVTDRIRSSVRTRDTAARLGGDEFSVLLERTRLGDATTAAERIIASLRDPFVVAGTAVQVRGSIGIAVAEADTDLDVLLRNADLAMYEAKARGGDGSVVFDPAMHRTVEARLLLEREVRDAVAAQQFAVYYQPIIDTRSGEVTSLEALVRWDHPQRGVVPPSEFLDAAERTGAIIDLGMFVMRTACEQVERWRADWPDLCVAVNLSHRQLLDPGLESAITAILSDTGLPAGALHLEITETVLAAEAEIWDVIQALSRLGVAFSIDDFGTGHSSLSRLRELTVQRLKIDKSFIREVNAGAAPLLSSIIALAHSLGRTVVAEGVETDEQLGFLLDNGCDEVQGYLFSRPIPPTHVVPMLFGRMVAPTGNEQEAPIFAQLIAQATNRSIPLSAVIDSLLRELREVLELDTTFFTTVDAALTQQVTRNTHNAGALTVGEGLAVPWEDTLCRRMIDDNVTETADVSSRYGDVAAGRELGIETYVTVPIRNDEGVLIGTLCGAGAQQVVVPNMSVELMELFASVLAERMTTAPTPPRAALDATNDVSPATTAFLRTDAKAADSVL